MGCISRRPPTWQLLPSLWVAAPESGATGSHLHLPRGASRRLRHRHSSPGADEQQDLRSHPCARCRSSTMADPLQSMPRRRSCCSRRPRSTPRDSARTTSRCAVPSCSTPICRCQLHKVSMTLELEADPDQLWNKFASEARTNIRRVYKDGLTVTAGGRELLPAFYSVMERSWRDLGTPLYAPSISRPSSMLFPIRLASSFATGTASRLPLHSTGITRHRRRHVGGHDSGRPRACRPITSCTGR